MRIERTEKKIGKDVGDDCFTLLYLHFFWTVPILNVRMRRGLKYFFSCAELEISSGGGGTVMVRIKTFHKYKHVEFNTIEQHKLGLSQTLSAALSIRDLLIAMALIWKKKITAWPTLPIAKTWQCTAYTRWGRWFSIIFFFISTTSMVKSYFFTFVIIVAAMVRYRLRSKSNNTWDAKCKAKYIHWLQRKTSKCSTGTFFFFYCWLEFVEMEKRVECRSGGEIRLKENMKNRRWHI